MSELSEALYRESQRRFVEWKDVISKKNRCMVRNDPKGYIDALGEEELAWEFCVIANQEWIDEELLTEAVGPSLEASM